MKPTIPAGAFVIAITLAVIPGSIQARSAQSYSENEIGLFVGAWLGDDFFQQSIPITDPFLGPVEYSSALNQGNAIVIGAHYTGYFSRVFGVDITVGYASGEWTTEGGRIVSGGILGETTVITGVTTIPLALNGIVRIPLPSPLPRPFVTGGLGAVFYEFSRSNAPFRIPPIFGTPLDTVLFDLDLGLRITPNVGAGLSYPITNRIGIRAEGRLWATIIHELISDERFVQRNKWFILSATFRL